MGVWVCWQNAVYLSKVSSRLGDFVLTECCLPLKGWLKIGFWICVDRMLFEMWAEVCMSEYVDRMLFASERLSQEFVSESVLTEWCLNGELKNACLNLCWQNAVWKVSWKMHVWIFVDRMLFISERLAQEWVSESLFTEICFDMVDPGLMKYVQSLNWIKLESQIGSASCLGSSWNLKQVHPLPGLSCNLK